MTNVIFERAASGILIATLIWSAVLVVERLCVFGIPVWWGLAGAAALALVITLAGAVAGRVSRLHAAVALDSAAGLKERISTALACQSDRDPFVQAAVHDAEQKAGGVRIPVCIPLRAPRLWGWSVSAIVLATLLGLLLPPLDLFAREERAQQRLLAQAQQAEKAAISSDLNKQFEKLKELAQHNPELAQLQDALQPLDVPNDPGQTPDDIRRDAVRRIDDVRDQLADKMRSGDLDMLKQLKKNLSQLNPLSGNDNAAKLSKALAAGDFSSAQEAVKQLKQELESAAKSSDPEQQQKARELQKRLDELAIKLGKLGDTAALRKELENKAGLSEQDAKDLIDKLTKSGETDPKALEKALQQALGGSKMSKQAMQKLARKISQNNKACKACQGLGQCLAQAAQAAQQSDAAGSGGGGAQGAGGALSNALGQLSDLEMSEQLMNELEAQISDLSNLRDGVCQNPGTGAGQQGQPGGTGPTYGLGYGDGIGKEKASHRLTPTKAELKLGPGEMIGQVLIDGPQTPGDAQAAEKAVITSAVRDAQDAIEYERVPRQYHPAIKAYFDRLAGLGNEAKPDKPAKPDNH